MPKAHDSDPRARLSPAARALLEERLRRAQAAAPAAPLIGRRPGGGPHPLSCAQEWVWLLIERAQHATPAPDSDAAYLIPNAVRLTGRLDVGALEAGFNELINRHEALRTSFPVVEGRRVQAVAGSLSTSLPVTDLSRLAPAEREAEVRRHIAEEVRLPFDLTRSPLLRARLLRTGEEEHVLLMTVHHIVSDGWSMSVLSKELSALYRALSEGRPSPLAELQIQYPDFAVWQREWLRGEAAKSQLDYWRRRLDGASLALNLPTDYPRPATQSFRGAKQAISVPAELTGALRELGQRSRATLFMTLLAAFNTLLHWFSEQEDILIGTHISGRVSAETEGVIGIFLNNLVLRTDLSGDPTCEELLGRVRETTLEAFDNQNLPFVELMRAVQPSPPLDRSPVVQVFFLLQNFPPSVIDLHGLESAVLNTGAARGTRDLSLTVTEKDGGLIASLQYDEALFAPATAVRLLDAFGRLLSDIAARPAARLKSLPLFESKYARSSNA